MILVDYSGIAVATLFSHGSNSKNIEEGLIRHQILNTLRAYNVKFRNEFGQMYLAIDGGAKWRRDIFPEYKASREVVRKESGVDWAEFYRILNLVKAEIVENIPFKVVMVHGCEADDIIATMVEASQEFGVNEKIMIVSSDKDFLQLQRYKNVKQFSPMKGQLIVSKDPIRDLHEKILRGDAGDGVPNVLSGDKVFITAGTRQTPLMAKKVNDWLEKFNDLPAVMPTEVYRNFMRNQAMINLSLIPEYMKNKIIEVAAWTKPAPNSKVLNYLISKRCAMLTSCASEFFSRPN